MTMSTAWISFIILQVASMLMLCAGLMLHGSIARKHKRLFVDVTHTAGQIHERYFTPLTVFYASMTLVWSGISIVLFLRII